jgi:large subunit ribosomal protein L25
MQQQIEMDAQVRDERGKNAAGRLRVAGRLPAVVYGLGKDSIAITIDSAHITRILQSPSGHNQIVNLTVGKERASVLASDWQIDPVKGHLLHVDLLRVDLKKTVDVMVSIEIVGISQGVREQGALEEIVSREVELRALPLKVPRSIPIDVTAMGVGDAVRVKDLALIDDVTFLSQPDRVLVHVIAPKVVEEETPEVEEVAEGAEPAAEEGEDEKDKDREKGQDKRKERD